MNTNALSNYILKGYGALFSMNVLHVLRNREIGQLRNKRQVDGSLTAWKEHSPRLLEQLELRISKEEINAHKQDLVGARRELDNKIIELSKGLEEIVYELFQDPNQRKEAPHWLSEQEDRIYTLWSKTLKLRRETRPGHVSLPGIRKRFKTLHRSLHPEQDIEEERLQFVEAWVKHSKQK